jgi:hypothetical protein
VERSGTPGTIEIYQPAREVGDSDWPNLNNDEMAHNKKLPPSSRA